jgi:arylsulfatase A-like enzyme
MNKTDSMNDRIPEGHFSKSLLNAICTWTLGAVLFWLVELAIVLAALPLSSDWRFVRDGNSITKSIGLLIRFDVVGAALISYTLAALFAAVIYVVVIYFLAPRRVRTGMDSLIHTGFLAFSYFAFGLFWMNFPYLPKHSFYVSIALNLIVLASGIFLTRLFHRYQRFHGSGLPLWLASVLTLDVFMLGALNIAREAVSFSVLNLRALVAFAALLVVCFAGFRLAWRVFRSRRLGSRLSGSLPTPVRYAVFVLPVVFAMLLVAQSSWITGAFRTRKAADPAKPNIVFIVMDTARADHLSCYGYKRPTTPNTDRVAREGALFRNVIAPSSWTLPSHASMFTGLFPSEHGADHLSQYLPPEIPTAASLLRDRGYKTLGCSNNPYVGQLTGLSRGFEEFEESWRRQKGRFFSDVIYKIYKMHMESRDPSLSVADEGAARTTKFVSNWIQQNHAEPFFIFINYLEPHAPYRPPLPHRTAFMNPGVSKSEIDAAISYSGDAQNWIFPSQPSPNILAVSEALYDGEISYVDSKIGVLYQVLSNLNILDNTLLIITSDHGENLGEHDLYGHSYGVFNTLLEVPLVIRHPKYFTAGSVIAQKVQTTDIFQTIMQAAGMPQKAAPSPLSKSLIERVKSQAYPDVCIVKRDRPTNLLRFARWTGKDASHIDVDFRAIIADGYKYIRSSGGGEELYNLESDPVESSNLISTQAETAIKLHRRLDRLVKTGSQMGTRRKIDRETEDRLKSLGYIR